MVVGGERVGKGGGEGVRGGRGPIMATSSQRHALRIRLASFSAIALILSHRELCLCLLLIPSSPFQSPSARNLMFLLEKKRVCLVGRCTAFTNS